MRDKSIDIGNPMKESQENCMFLKILQKPDLRRQGKAKKANVEKIYFVAYPRLAYKSKRGGRLLVCP